MQYWYHADGRQVGPISLAELKAALAQQAKPQDTLVWHNSFANWTRAADVPDLLAPGLPQHRPGAATADQTTGFLRLWFGFSGRINRAKYWLVVAVNFAIMVAAVTLAVMVNAPFAWMMIVAVIVILALLWLAISVRRLHDRNKSAWWMVPYVIVPAILNLVSEKSPDPSVAVVVAVIGLGISVVAFVELGFLRGTNGDNRFGLDPVAASLQKSNYAAG